MIGKIQDKKGKNVKGEDYPKNSGSYRGRDFNEYLA